MRNEFLPFALPDIGESEFDEVRAVLESAWLTTGPKTRKFEAEFAKTVGAEHAVAVNSCTAAMHLALEALGVAGDDFVITTPYTFAATAEVVRYLNAIPVFVDIERDTLNLDPQLVEDKVRELKASNGGRVRAVIPVHIGGHPCDMSALESIAKRYNYALVEDAAHAFPAACDGASVGALGHRLKQPSFACFSFYATKTITTGEGGMLITNDPDMEERCRSMSLHGINKSGWTRYTTQGEWYYEIAAPGFKYNMPDLAAAIGLAQLRKAYRMRVRREDIAQRYNESFSDFPALETPTVRRGIDHAWHLYLLRLNTEALSIERNRFFEELRRRKICASVHFIPLHLHPYYRETFGYRPEDFPIAYGEYQRVISLPIYSRMSDSDVDDVIEAVADIVKTYHR